MISPKAKTPTASTMNSSPSQRCGCPKVKRSVPELRSVPTQPRMTPTRIIPIALGIEPEDSETAPISPTTISEKYSAAPKRYARSEEHTAELHSLIRIEYAGLCLIKTQIQTSSTI